MVLNSENMENSVFFNSNIQHDCHYVNICVCVSVCVYIYIYIYIYACA